LHHAFPKHRRVLVSSTQLLVAVGGHHPRLFDGPAAAPNHIVQFYDDERYLCDAIVQFIGTGLANSEPCVVIAIEERRAALVEGLRARSLDPDRAVASGQLVLLDPFETLKLFMVNGAPDWHRFKKAIGGVLDKACAGRPTRMVRAYGEMVDVLWRDGQTHAAVRLEELWNDLGKLHPFSLLCAYVMGNFLKASDGAQFEAVCRNHTHVLPAESYIKLDDSDARLREVSLLQQRARALQSEVEHRRALERALRDALAERTLAEEALRRSQEQLTDFVENAAEGLHWVGPDSTVLWANRAELELLGYTKDEYVGHSITEFHVDAEVIADILARLKRDETLRDYEARLRCKDGSVKHVLINSNVAWRDGEFMHTRCFTRDITQRKQAEEALHAARIEAEAATRAKDEFLAMLGHELRNPLAPIVTALQLMKLKGDDTSSKEQQVIERQVDHLIRLVDDLLDISRITRGKIDLKKEPIDLASAVAKAVEIASPLLEHRQHHFTVSVPRTGLRLEADAVRLVQVLANLLTNAAKYTDPGGNISLGACREGDEVVITTRDNGVGITPELLPRLFDLFVQGARSADRQQGGLGIGLTLVRTLVQMHGGSVTAKSDGPGAGSEFVVRLPALAADSARVESPRLVAPVRAAGATRKILLVDDNVDAADLLGEVLRSDGHEVLVVHDGVQALAALDHFSPDVAILDIGLPVMDGYELAVRLRERLGAQTPSLFAVTGYGQENDRARSRQAGFAEHFVKPIVPDKLLGRLAKL
jgi:PAS domain S-box-containing protein